MKKNKKSKPNNLFIGFLLIIIAIITFFNTGILGLYLTGFSYWLIGYLYYPLAIVLFIYGCFYMQKKQKNILKNKFFYIVLELFVIAFLVFTLLNEIFSVDVLQPGFIFTSLYDGVYFLVGNIGVGVIYVSLLLLLIEDIYLRIHKKSLYKLLTKKMKNSQDQLSEARKQAQYKKQINELKKQDELKKKQQELDNKKLEEEKIKSKLGFEEKEKQITTPVFEQEVTKKVVSDIPNFESRQGDYIIPSVELLLEITNNDELIKKLNKNAKEKAARLIQALSDFGLKVEITAIIIGPSVTKYELLPQPGVKVNKFLTLSNDISLALAASSVRIEAPIPGKSVVGIEIPNEQTIMVGLKEVLSQPTNDFSKKLQVGLGKDISGNPAFLEINKTPHLLVAGSTGSGKSVCINSIIVSILLKATPDEVKMIMIDPKKVELTPYNDIPHLLTSVVTDPKKASSILNKMVQEMEERYELFAKTNTRNIETYNQAIKTNPDLTFKKLPYIVIIVDELADLMMVASSEVETSIARLAQMARAAGMHLIIATQRPSTDVITGLIKSNIPSRIAFAVSSSIDSRTILDSGGAEKLLGRGDMFISSQTENGFRRIQGAYLSDEEIQAVVGNIKAQYENQDMSEIYDENLTNIVVSEDNDIDELDEIYEQVKADVIIMQKASASFIQRKYKVGYNRALRIIDQLESNGVVGPNEGPKPRKVLILDDESNTD